MKIGDIIETYNGVATVTYVRYQGGDVVLETTAGTFTADEVELIS